MLDVALADPLNTAVLDDLAFMTGGEGEGGARLRPGDRRRRSASTTRKEETLDTLLDEIESEASQGRRSTTPRRWRDSAPVVKLLNYILFTAIRDRVERHPLRAVRGRVPDPLPRRRRPLRAPRRRPSTSRSR